LAGRELESEIEQLVFHFVELVEQLIISELA
jgi:hypothetical protein